MVAQSLWYNAREMVEPRIIPRAEHQLSRRDVDPDALKVLYRLRQFEHVAYLVGGSVRDLLLGRRPKDFDIGTSAHPYQVKKLFRNCWIIGRRFRLAHVKFGQKVIEVATFRRQVEAGEEVVQDGVPAPDASTPDGEQLIHHDNTFGTPEQDAFRRDFTINALVYDIATFSIIDYVGGLDDLRAGLVRSIGDPEVRLHEDPVRMLRAVALAARLDFAIDRPVLDAIRLLRHEIAKSSPPRLLEEYYKILRAGSSEKAFRGLAELGLIEPISPELQRGATDALWRSLAALDSYRRQFESTPDTLSNAILLGSLLVPLGIPLQPSHDEQRPDQRPAPTGSSAQGAADRAGKQRRPPALKLGELPLARRDVERLQQIISLQRRLRELNASPRAQRALTHRGMFREALLWMEIHGESPEVPGVVEHWKGVLVGEGEDPAAPIPPPVEGEGGGDQQPRRKRRRRRRRRSRPATE
jgi:poly(A) polymerase